MQWAWAHGHIVANPVMAVDYILPEQSTKTTHPPAMPRSHVPQFVESHLAKHTPGDSTRAALLFPILTAARGGEVRGATWNELDLVECVWNIPAARMKAKEPHRIPLSEKALTLIKMLKHHQPHETLVFPSPCDQVEAAYHRTDLLEQRRPLMEAWAQHVYAG
ncbi:phage integrase [Burkholderia contaminans]|uniref:Phage integrase n=2 Tax=Burkholderia TaxID=32008 RepID=A0A6P2WUH9_9BURK|nr:phage integrase [Burkholderia contaminans]